MKKLPVILLLLIFCVGCANSPMENGEGEGKKQKL